MSPQIRIVEKNAIPFGAAMLYGIPDVGLVGLIATSYVISELNLTEVAHVDSDLLPPVVILHDGLPHAPLRIFSNGSLIAAISELAIPTKGIHQIMRALTEWSKNKGAKLTISMGGIPTPERQDIAEPKVYGAASTPELIQMLQNKNIEILKEGFMVGPQALVMRYCAEINVPAITLLAQSFYNYPDPEAAAAVIRELNNILGLKVDVTKLLEKGEEIRLKARDIMRRTQQEMGKMKKTQEYDLPLYV